MIESGALGTEDPGERQKRGLKTNPDGDVDVPGVDYNTFRYPPCPKCLADKDRKVDVDTDGAWSQGSEAGILKPAVIMFGESIPAQVKLAVESAIDEASSLMVLGSSLATYSAWRLVKRAKDQGKRIAVINMGGVRGEEAFFAGVPRRTDGSDGVRCNLPLEQSLPALVERLEQERDGGKVFRPAPWA
ncbi:related to sirtuin type 4 [Ramularia collo-cygni]|uniref:Related to sirtuin type 4 n=1 Tax=Ramularia collo-cygni TaxID=112498 RepID=A0A2D3UWI5_9PEZI|nr:related to sirtuin type 4 [Ramularia collo-cygni]CZT16587.1 related to sirtuin type 4 [Ramularia collo-cygni]